MQEFLRSACHLMLIDIYMKFCEDNLNVFKLYSRHDFVIESKGQ